MAVQKYWTKVILLLPAVTVYSFLPGSLHRDGCVHVLGLRFVPPHVVAASLVPTVAAAAIRLELDVASSLMSAVATAAISSERQRWTRRFAGLLCLLTIACVVPLPLSASRRSRHRPADRTLNDVRSGWSCSSKRERRCGVISCALWLQPEAVCSSAPPAGPRRARLAISLRSSSRWKIKGRSSVQRWLRQRRRRLGFLQISRETPPDSEVLELRETLRASF